MEQRSISDRDALKALTKGCIEGPIEAGKSAGEWKCKMVYRLKASRDVGVVTVVMRNGRLWVKTVE